MDRAHQSKRSNFQTATGKHSTRDVTKLIFIDSENKIDIEYYKISQNLTC